MQSWEIFLISSKFRSNSLFYQLWMICPTKMAPGKYLTVQENSPPPPYYSSHPSHEHSHHSPSSQLRLHSYVRLGKEHYERPEPSLAETCLGNLSTTTMQSYQKEIYCQLVPRVLRETSLKLEIKKSSFRNSAVEKSVCCF